MGTRRVRLRADDGFTLIELIIGIVITSIIIGAIASALVVSFRTTDVTQQRMAESHDAQISSAYLANDVQSAAGVHLGSGGDCSGASTTLVTFDYASGHAVYSCGTSSGEIRVTRTFEGDSVVLAHFAGAARPTVSCSPDAACSGVVDSVTMAFTEASGYSYTLLGSRRGFANGGGGGGSLPSDVTLLSTGSSSPLWVQGSCQNGGTDPGAACALDPSSTALPISDVSKNGWTLTPSSPTTLWDKLNDQSDSTWANTITKNKEAQVAMAAVNPPDPGTNPTVELRTMSTGGGVKLAVSLYDLTTSPTALVSNTININGNSSISNSNWALSAADTSKIPASAYAHLTVGFALTGNGTGVNVYGVAFDTANPAGLLTIKGSLYVNSTLSNAVRLTGSKTATKITINPGDFRILNPGACSGCNHNTVTCSGCSWTGQQPWTSYPTSLPDPLRSLAAPDPATLGTGSCSGSVCQPGVYNATLSRTANTTLNPGIYYLKQGISITGSAALTCAGTCPGGVMLYIAGGGVTLAGGSTIDLTAPSAGVYKNIVIFQARTDTNEVKITGNAGSATPISFRGIIYVPNSTQVTLATGSATLTAKAIVAQNIKVSSSVTIG